MSTFSIVIGAVLFVLISLREMISSHSVTGLICSRIVNDYCGVQSPVTE